MNEQIIQIAKTWGVSLVILVVGVLVGWTFKRFIHVRLSRLADRTSWQGDDIILKAMEPQIILWFFLAALLMASSGISIGEPYSGYLAKLTLIILILSITIALSNVLVGMMNLWAEKQDRGFPSTEFFTKLVRIIVIVIGLMIALDSLDISITPVLTALGVGGLAVSLALKDTLADFFSGMHILLSQKVKPGDFVKLDSGEQGYIKDITWRNTSMMERTNNMISIPNSKLSTAIVKNFDTGDQSFSVKVAIGVSYESDLDHVEKVTEEVASTVMQDVEGGIPDFKPPVRFYEFDDSSINLKVYFRVRKYGDQHGIVDAFIKRLHRRYAEEGIEIPFPIRTLVQKDQ